MIPLFAAAAFSYILYRSPVATVEVRKGKQGGK